MRKLSNIPPPEELTHNKLDVIEQERKYELITPLYGGGVIATEPDPITVVRATAIRGQLRFWWRACYGGQSGDNPDMKIREAAIWGKAYEKGDKGIPPEQTVQIIVNTEPSRHGKAIKPLEIQRRRAKFINGIPSYAAFPIQPDQKELQKSQPFIPDLWEGVCFTLTISYPSRLRQDIEAALWAWETFGGIGARSRRGFGTLHLLEIDGTSYQSLPTSRDVELWIRNEAHKHIKPGSFPHGLPHLSREMQLVVTPPFENPMRAWNHLIRKLQDFRQQKDENNRSAWPEADAIRKIANKRTKNVPSSPQKYPRAAFGLPIIFHFTGNNAPKDHTLNEADIHDKEHEYKERFASPLILRPFLCQDNRAVGLALLLEGSRVDLKHLVLQDERKALHPVEGTLTESEAHTLTNRLPILYNETDILQAFMNSLKEVR